MTKLLRIIFIVIIISFITGIVNYIYKRRNKSVKNIDEFMGRDDSFEDII